MICIQKTALDLFNYQIKKFGLFQYQIKFSKELHYKFISDQGQRPCSGSRIKLLLYMAVSFSKGLNMSPWWFAIKGLDAYDEFMMHQGKDNLDHIVTV
jgi:hypothetical protein